MLPSAPFDRAATAVEQTDRLNSIAAELGLGWKASRLRAALGARQSHA
jgi:hypothetical protein